MRQNRAGLQAGRGTMAPKSAPWISSSFPHNSQKATLPLTDFRMLEGFGSLDDVKNSHVGR